MNGGGECSEFHILIYAPPAMSSVETYWPAEQVGGASVVGLLVNQLRRAVPVEWPIAVIAQKETARRFEAQFRGAAVTVFGSRQGDHVGAVLEYLKSHPRVGRVAVFSALQPLICAGLLQEQHDFHLRQQADAPAPCSAVFPSGVLPEIIEAKAARQIGQSLTLRRSRASFAAYLDWANAAGAMPDGRSAPFRVLAFEAGMARLEMECPILPWVVQVDSRRALAALQSALRPETSGDAGMLAQVADFWRIVQASHISVRFDPEIRRDRRRILFCAPHGAYSGAEESFYQLIASMRRSGSFEPVVVAAYRTVLTRKLAHLAVSTAVAEEDISRLSPECYELFMTAIRETLPECIHVNGAPPPGLVIAAIRVGLPVIAHARIHYLGGIPETLRFASRIIAISRSVKANLLRGGLPEASVQVIYNGIALDYARDASASIELRGRFGWGAQSFVLIMVARICRQKNQILLLDAVTRLLWKKYEVKVVFIGETYPADEEYAAELAHQVAHQGLASHVGMWGFEPDMAPLYLAANALVLCSNDEPFGRCVMEASACGLPCVLPRRGGFAEIWCDRIDCLMYDNDSSEKLALAVEEIYRNPALGRSLGMESRQTVKRLDLDAHRSAIEAVYQSVRHESAPRYSEAGQRHLNPR